MFERYTEKARRVIFFARYEASVLGSPYIELEHMLLGLMREDKGLMDSVLPDWQKLMNFMRGSMQKRATISTSVDLPLSHESKKSLVYAGEEAERFGHQTIETIHLLCGLLRETTPLADLVRKHGLDLEKLRKMLREREAPRVRLTKGSAAALHDVQAQFRACAARRLTHEIVPALAYRLRTME